MHFVNGRQRWRWWNAVCEWKIKDGDCGKFVGNTNHILGKNGAMEMAIKESIKYHSNHSLSSREQQEGHDSGEVLRFSLLS